MSLTKTNAKEELLTFLEKNSNKEIQCAKIVFSERKENEETGSSNLVIPIRDVLLKTYYTNQDYQEFINQLNFNYGGSLNLDDSVDIEIDGTIWFRDGSWAERDSYDSKEWWQIRCLPEISKDLLP